MCSVCTTELTNSEINSINIQHFGFSFFPPNSDLYCAIVLQLLIEDVLIVGWNIEGMCRFKGLI